MEVILNGERRSIDVSDCANLAELVAAAEAFGTHEEACVVTGIEIDGEKLTPEQMSGLEARGLQDVAQVAIERQPARVLASAVLRQGAEYSREVVKAIDRTVEHFRSARSDLANELFAHVSDSLTVLVGISASATGVLSDGTDELARIQGELFPWLERLIQAQTEEDPIGIGDLLEYEIAPRVAAWGDCMRELSARTDSPPSEGLSS